VVLTPLVGVWVASSLVAYNNGPVWLVCLCGLLLFPGLPLAWELLARHRRHKRLAGRQTASERPRLISLRGRIVLRTLVINLAFLTALLALYPRAGFVALSTRGDWMLGPREEGWRGPVRRGLFFAAGGLEWLYDATRDNPHAKYARGKTPRAPAPNDTGGAALTGAAPISVGLAPPWPMPATLHPVVAAMTRSDEASMEAVARHIARGEKDPFLLVKALHDWVADRISYDYPALAGDAYKGHQTAPEVFRTRKGVCSGYASLMVALGRLAGAEIVYVHGKARGRQDSDLDGNNHSWNAAKIRGRWYLLDATWSSPRAIGKVRKRKYQTLYLFTPPELFGLNHFPKVAAWQLLTRPLSRGEFLRQPWINPRLSARGYALLAPRRSQISVSRVVTVRLRNSKLRFVLGHLRRGDQGEPVRCAVKRGPITEVRCAVPAAGRYTLTLFDSPTGRGWHGRLLKLQINAR